MRGEIDGFKCLVRICLRTTIEDAFRESENGESTARVNEDVQDRIHLWQGMNQSLAKVSVKANIVHENAVFS